MKRFRFMIPVVLGLCLMGQSSWAAKAYVTDSFRISLRRGPSIENKILKFLPSGVPVEVLESEDGWSRVQPLAQGEGGIKGWVLSRYLIARQPWETQAKSSLQRAGLLNESLLRAENELEESSRLEQKLTKKLETYIDSFDRLQDEYAALKRGASDYLKLKAAHEMTQKTLQGMAEEIETLQISQKNRWFAIGALILLSGLMIGLLIGRQQKKRQTSVYF